MDVADAIVPETRPMTPDAILAAFDTPGLLPRAALTAAGAWRAELVPRFLDRIDALAAADLDAASEDVSFTIIYHLLAEWRETRAYRPMLRLLRGDPELVDALMGDGITECAARVVAGLFDGDLQPILAAVLDEKADEFVRGEMFEALAMVARERPEFLPDVVDFLRHFPGGSERGHGLDRVGAVGASRYRIFGLADLREEVRAASTKTGGSIRCARATPTSRTTCAWRYPRSGRSGGAGAARSPTASPSSPRGMDSPRPIRSVRRKPRA